MLKVIRWAGIIATFASLTYAAYWLLLAAVFPNDAQTLMLTILLVGVLAALVGLALRLVQSVGVLASTAVSLIAFPGILLLLLGTVIELSSGSSGPAAWILLAGLLVSFLGLTALGIMVLSVGSGVRWCGLILIASIPAYMFMSDFGVLATVAIGVGWSLVGLTLIRASSETRSPA